jgi:hypothetical protein
MVEGLFLPNRSVSFQLLIDRASRRALMPRMISINEKI